MISGKELDIVLHYPRVATRFQWPMGAELDSSSQLLQVPTSWRYKLRYAVFLVAVIHLTVFSGYRVLTSISIGSRPERQALYLAHFLTMVPGCLGHLIFAIWRHELAELFNMLLTFNQIFASNKPKSGRRDREKWLGYLYWTLMLVIFGACLPAFCAIEFLYGWTTRGGLLFACVQVLLVFAYACGTYILCGHVQMLPFAYFTGVLDRFQRPLENEDSIATYRALSILATVFNRTYGLTLVPTLKFAVGISIMTCFVGALRLPGTGITSAIMRTGLLGVALYYLGLLTVGANLSSGLWTKSTDYIKRWRNKINTSEYNRHVALSLAPIKFGVAGLYFMERQAKLTFLDSLLNGTLTMLIAFQ